MDEEKWVVQQRLVRLQLLAKSLSGEEIARELISILSINYGIESPRLLASMRDGAATNCVAVRTLKIVYPNAVDITCFSHTLDRVGQTFNLPILNEFISLWISMFSHSPKARLAWKALTGRTMQSYSATRWWSKWEVMKQVLVQFGDVEPFLDNHMDMAPSLTSKLRSLCQDVQKNVYLQLELAAVVDWGEHFVKATYTLEGDGPLGLRVYEVINTIVASIHTAHCPNVQAIAKKLEGKVRSVSLAQMLRYAQGCVQQGLDYFQEKLDSTLKDAFAIFKAARLFSPQKTHSMQPTASDIDCLRAFPFFTQDVIDQLKKELPVYLSKCADTDPDFCPLTWWKQNASALPNWATAASKSFLVQPSSAASERVFSLLKASFDEQQTAALQDYLEASLMLQYNNR